MQLGQSFVDEVKAEDGAPAGQLHERRLRAAGNSSIGNHERHPSIGHGHRVRGQVRGIEHSWRCKPQRKLWRPVQQETA
eukprot:3201009-Pleurochrysis_carterae.AAC.1